MRSAEESFVERGDTLGTEDRAAHKRGLWSPQGGCEAREAGGSRACITEEVLSKGEVRGPIRQSGEEVKNVAQIG